MKWSLVVTLLIGLLAGIVFGQSRGPQSRTVTLAEVSSARADITKLDWLLLKAEMRAIKDTQPVSDLGWPTYVFDRPQNRLVANVFVNDRWWSQSDAKTVKDKLQSNGMLYCVSPFAMDQQLEGLVGAKATRCEVNFYTYKTAERSTLATFFLDRNELVLK